MPRKDLSPSQRRLLNGIAVVAALIAVVLLSLRLSGNSTLPPAIPLLLLLSAIGLVLATAPRRD